MFGLVSTFFLLALLAWGTWRRPAVAFSAVLCLYGLKQWGQNTSPFLTEHRTIANFAVAALVILGLVRSRFSASPHEWRVSQPGKFGIALYLYAVLTLMWTPLLDVTLDQWSQHVPYILTIVVLAPLLFSNVDDVKTACHWTIVVGGAVCLLALFAGKWGTRGLLLNGNIYGHETNPLALAGLGGTILIMTMVAMPTNTTRLLKLLYPVLAVAGLAVILRSGSRGQLVAAAISALIGWHLASKRQNITALLGAVVVGAIFALVGFWVWDQLGVDSARWTSDQSADDVTGRLDLAFALLAESMSNPATLLFGIGNSASFYYIGGYPHVAAIEIVAEEGLIGTTLYVGILVTAFQSVRTLIKIAKTEQSGSMRYVVAVLTSLFIFEWILTLKQGTLLSCTYFIAYAAIFGRVSMWSQQNLFAPTFDAPKQLSGATFANLMR